MNPGEHLHEGGLARAVLSADRVDLAAPHAEADAVQRSDSGELLDDVLHLKDVVGLVEHLIPSHSWRATPPR